MDARISVSENDILEAMRRAVEAQPNEGERGITTLEWGKARGCSVHKARAEIRLLLDSGAAECVQVRRARMDKKPTLVSGYRLR